MNRIVIVWLMILTSMAAQITLTDEGYTRSLQASSMLNLTIDSRQPYLYIEIISCGTHILTVSNILDDILKPMTVLQPANFLYKINATAKIDLKSSEETKLRILPIKSERDMPRNNFGIDAYFDEQSLSIAFEPVRFFDKVATANYSIWFAAKSQDLHCPMLSNDTVGSGLGVVRMASVETDKELLQIDVPLIDRISQTDSNLYVNRTQIIDLLSARQSFFIGIVADMNLPTKMTFVYQPIKVDHQLNIVELEVGLAIMLIGVMVYALISITYLYCKRKYRQEDEFGEQVDEQGGKSESESAVVS